MPADNRQGVALPEGHTGSSFFLSVLSDAVDAFPEELGGVRLPDSAKAFKKRYASDLYHFEAARTGSEKRVA